MIPGFYDVNIRSPLTKIITEKTFCMDFQKNNKMKKHKKRKKRSKIKKYIRKKEKKNNRSYGYQKNNKGLK